jgi:hypothetical protein
VNRRSWTTVTLLASAGGLCLAAQRCARLPGGFLAVPSLATLLGSFLAGFAVLAFAVALLALLYRVTDRSVPPAGDRLSRAVERSVDTLLPFLLLGLYPLAVLVLHPLGAPPALLTLFGLKYLAALAAVLILLRLGEAMTGQSIRLRAAIRGLLRRERMTHATVLFLAFMAIYASLALHEDRRNLIVGDEPHYLLVMDSIKKYGTPDLTSILASGDFGDGVRRVVPHKSGHSRPGAIYEVHSIGIPLLMVVPHALGGYRGVIFLFSLLAALVVCQIFLLCDELTGRRRASLLVASLVGLTAPMIFYSRSIYPELPAALVIIYAVRQILVRKERPLMPVALTALGIAFLPWLHVKFLMFSAVLLLAMLLTRGPRSRTFLLTTAAGGVSLAAMMAFFAHAFGSPLPNAQYGASEMPISPFLLRGVPGLFFDQDHGLIPHAPYFLFLAAGLSLFWARHKKAFWLVAGIAAPFILVAGSHWMWWGGPCAPGRFLLPVVPLLAPVLVLGISRLNNRRRLLWSLLAASALLVGLASILNPGVLTTHRHVIYDFLFQGQEGFPSFPKFFFHRTEGVFYGNYLLLALWVAVVLPLARRARQGKPRPGPGRSGLLLVLSVFWFLLFPGLAAEGRHLIERKTGAWEAGNLSLPQMSYQLAIGPWKAGNREMSVLPSPAPGEFPKRLIAVQRYESTATRKEGDGERTYITRGPYFLLYPVPYEVVFDVKVRGIGNDNNIGELFVSGDGGRRLITRRDLSPAMGSRQAVRMSFIPEGQVVRSEFQGFLERPGEVTLQTVRITAQVDLPGRE